MSKSNSNSLFCIYFYSISILYFVWTCLFEWYVIWLYVVFVPIITRQIESIDSFGKAKKNELWLLTLLFSTSTSIISVLLKP